MNDIEFNTRVWEISSIIKLVSTFNIKAICTVATNIRHNFNPDDIDKIDNKIIYEAYIKQIRNNNDKTRGKQ